MTSGATLRCYVPAMRCRGIVVAVLGALLVVLLGPAGSAPAAVAFEGETTTHAVGMPVATEPWRTLVSAAVRVETTYDGVDTWSATAQLGAAVPAGEEVEITWTTGRWREGRCEPIATFVERTATVSADNSVRINPTTFETETQVDEFDPTPLCIEISLESQGVQSDLLVGAMTADDAAAAIVGVSARATEHAEGFPQVTDPWRTLESATFDGDLVSGMVHLSATFGGPVPEGESWTINWNLGRQHPQGCEVLLNFAEQDLDIDDANTMSVDREYEYGDLGSSFSCFEVSLSIGESLDKLVGVSSPIVADVTVAAAPTGRELVVAAGRRTPVIVTASSRIGARRGLTLAGRGRGVRAPRTATGAVEARRDRPVVLRIGAGQPGRSRLLLTARDRRFDEARSRTSWPVLVRRIAPQRPRPGLYRSSDGRVRFRVTRDFVVEGLRAVRLRCAGTRSRRTVRLPHGVPLPPGGAAARVVPTRDPDLGRGFIGAHLLTTSSTHAIGAFVVSTRTCSGSVRFTAERRD